MQGCIKSATMVGLLLSSAAVAVGADGPRTLRAGAAVVDVTPQKFPVIMNGNFFAKEATAARDPLCARGLVLDDGATKLAIVVVDACMLERELLDAAKATASADTGIPPERMLISATHTHSSPSGMGCLGTPVDEAYASFVRVKIADCIKQAAAKTVPARVGRAAVDLWSHTFCRAWIRRPDRMLDDPFGVKNVRSNMHPGHQSPDVVGPTSPVDPQFSLLSVQTADGKPLALLANYSMHYFGVRTPEVSSDYTGRWCRRMEETLGPQADAAMPFVALFSQGTSGDSMWMDYSEPRPATTLEEYTEGLVEAATRQLKSIEYRSDVALAMAETKLTLARRIPDAERLKWAKETLAAMDGRPPKDRREIYAREAIYLHETPVRELKLQAVRVGDFGIAAIPNEVFAVSGLKIKRMSPLAATMNVALANGSEGYIPPAYQHPLGGYTTWPARTAALEVQAESKIVAAVIQLLEQVAEKPRREVVDEHGPYAKAVLESKPVAYWRLNEWEGPTARDASGNGNDAKYVGGAAFYLPGAQRADAAVANPPEQPSAFSGRQINRAPQFAGGRLQAELPQVGEVYTVEFWFWSGQLDVQEPLLSTLAVRGTKQGDFTRGEGMTLWQQRWDPASVPDRSPRQLQFENGTGSQTTISDGGDAVGPRRWHHVVLVRQGTRRSGYLDGRPINDTDGGAPHYARDAPWCFGSESDGSDAFEGRLDEIAVYDRPLSADEVARHYAAAKR